MDSIFDKTITLGEFISIGLTLFAGFAYLVRLAWQRYKVINVFDLRVPLGDYQNQTGFEKEKSLNSLGIQDILVRVSSREAITYSKVNFRCYPDMKGQKPASIEDIEVAYVWDPEWEFNNKELGPGLNPIPRRIVSRPDTLGGQDVYFNVVTRRAANEPMWFRVVVNPKKNWEGFLSFQTEAPDGRRRTKRLKLTVVAE